MTGRRGDGDGIAVCLPVSTAYRKSSIRPAGWFLARALRALLDAGGLAAERIDGLAVSSFGVLPDHAIFLAEQFGLHLRFAQDVPYGGVAGIMALRRAAAAVRAGDARMVACIAGDSLGGGRFTALVSGFSGDSRDAIYPHGGAGPNAIFSMLSRDYMRRTGAVREDFGRIVIACRENGRRNPAALLGRPLTMADYLAARPIAPPLGLFDCVMPCAGAEAFLVTSPDRARRLGLPHALLLASCERHNAHAGEVPQTRFGWDLDAGALYAAAGLGPAAMDFAQLYDDYPVMVIAQLEELGFAPAGGGPDFVRRTDLAVGGGGLPVNTGGGQLAIGQAGAAAGHLGVAEAVRQLIGAGGARQVDGARHGLVSGFGMVNYLRGLSTGAALLAAAAGP